MAVSLKKIKKELQADIGKVGKKADGTYKFVPPNIVGRKINKYPTLKVTRLKQVPDVKNQKIKVTSLVSSEEKPSHKYKVTIHFHDVKYNDLPSAQFYNKVLTTENNEKIPKYYRDLSYGSNPVTLRCQCLDFRHRFQKPLKDAGGLYGGFIGYTRKTDPWPVGYPYANSTNKLGVCKHITSVLRKLEDEGILKNR